MSEWRDIYVEVRGTMLNFHRVKDGRPSRLLRSYTLQHAEIGLAPDVCHTVLAPNSKLAHLIPSAARQKAFRKDPQLFRAEEQYIMRLRVETDQILLAHKSEDKILEMVHEIGAGIDLAPAIDERSISKQCTVPRRRRRPNTQTAADINSAAVIAEQERILQQMYPSFAQDTTEQNTALTASSPATSTPTTPLGTPTREDDELDLSAIREDFTETNTLTQTTTSASTNSDRPGYFRTITASSTSSAFQTTYETAPSNFGPEGKWQPPHLRTAVQIRRYVRRCAPLLMSDAVRASDIVICNGKRMRINWREERLQDWRLQPPTYHAHDFEKEQQRKENEATAAAAAQKSDTDIALNHTHDSTSPNAPSSVFSETFCSQDDDITPLEERSEQAGGLAHLDLVKSSSSGSAKGTAEAPTTSTATTLVSRQKAREVQRDNNTADAQSIVFCF